MSETDGLQFVDTNILVYAHDRSAGTKHVAAGDLVRALWQSGKGCISVRVLQEFYVTITQKVTNPMAPQVAAQLVGDLSTWQVHRPGIEDVLDAIRLQGRYHISFWDAMIISSAIQLDCRVIWSEDLNPGQAYDQVQVLSPF